jgi:hypothetical protein
MGTTNTRLYSSRTPFGYATGVNYSREANIAKVGETQADADVTQIATIAKMFRVFDWNEHVMKKALDLGLEVALGTNNSQVSTFANDKSACSAYVKQITPYAEVIKIIAVGNEVFAANLSAATVVSAITNLNEATKSLKIPITTDCIWSNVAHSSASAGWAPKGGTLTGEGRALLAGLKQLFGREAYLMCSFYPYIDVKGWVSNNGVEFAKNLLPYALFQDAGRGPVANQFDSDIETLRYGMQADYLDVAVICSETGWATGNYDDWCANVNNLNAFINGFQSWQRENNISVPTFMFEMYDEPAKGSSSDESKYGLFSVSSELKSGLSLPKWK